MKTPFQVLEEISKKLNISSKIAFVTAFVVGLFTHMPAFLSDVPNHDGLASMYFNQDMITSGRWFLTVACGASGYFTVPWVIGVLSLLFLAIAAALLVSVLKISNPIAVALVSGLLVTFPALASTAAYVFTMDGYMLGLLLSILAVYLTEKSKKGFILGGISLAFCMGIYQAYLPVTVILCLYMSVLILLGDEGTKEKIKKILNYLYMGVIGTLLYYGILTVLLKLRNLSLDTYQGINGLADKNQIGIKETVTAIYRDFIAFTIRGNVLADNIFSITALILLGLVFIVTLILIISKKNFWKKPLLYIVALIVCAILPICFGMIMIISPKVNFHLLMRYQWVLIPILFIAFFEKFGKEAKFGVWLEWTVTAAAFVMIFNYFVADNIAYTNLSKKYEKTYAYCERLLDRIEQTDGYYPGIPVAMIGVVSDKQYPVSDITQKVTGSMIGITGDYLLYTPANYEAFMKNYLGATLNYMEVDEVTDIYYSDEYVEMDSFPGPNSTKVVDGILYVKTENCVED